MKLNIREVLSFFDERPPTSIGHATAIVSMIGEDVGVALLQECLKDVDNVSTTVIMDGDRPWTPTLGTGRGFRLDRWLLAHATPPTLYQVEIKNWSAHALGGDRDIPNERSNDEEFLKSYRKKRWEETWDRLGNCFRWGECGKVLTRMAVPTTKDVPPGILVEPILCFWWPIHPAGEDESLFCHPLPSVLEGGFKHIRIFSMSNYLRSILRGGKSEIDLDMPSATQRLAWLRSFDESTPDTKQDVSSPVTYAPNRKNKKEISENQNDRPVFVQVENAFINVESIAYVEQNEAETLVIATNTADATGKPKQFVLTPRNAAKLLELLQEHSVGKFGP